MRTFNKSQMKLNFERVSNTFFNATADNHSLEQFSNDSDMVSSYDSKDGVHREGRVKKLNGEPIVSRSMTHR